EADVAQNLAVAIALADTLHLNDAAAQARARRDLECQLLARFERCLLGHVVVAGDARFLFGRAAVRATANPGSFATDGAEAILLRVGLGRQARELCCQKLRVAASR